MFRCRARCRALIPFFQRFAVPTALCWNTFELLSALLTADGFLFCLGQVGVKGCAALKAPQTLNFTFPFLLAILVCISSALYELQF